ncbi:exonuclease V isoform X1 [Strongylocentrotus purpuratus]|uniref:Exonuclease V n=1 Tax=Strongylocentrotus purpuratus TaxID=7668 RepID=A0A7M7T1U0_STRPU|nr:exonuclease V isoform X1 [Strongylocentrotus purpuratus]
MAEKTAKQAPVAIRLTSSRATASRCTENQKKERESSGGDGEMCFGDEWLDDWEDEAILHQAMDDLDQSLKSNSTSVSDNTKSFSQNDDKTEKNLGEVSRTICSCEKSSVTDPADSILAEEQNEKGVEVSAGKESAKEDDCKENVCHNCQRTIAKRTESDIATNASPTKKAKMDLEEETKKFTMDPLREFRGKYLWVSDLTAQAWCERQLLYDFTGIEGKPVEILETEAMKVGTDMHLKRELEVHTIKQIAVKTKEDKWAIKFLNILSAVNQLLQGGGGGGGASRCVVREMPIFGKPFESGAFVVGVIDEIRYNSRGQLEVVEFKTRAKSRTVPSAAQRKTHKLQVMLYKQLFDEAVCGLLKKETILETIGLDPDASVNDEITAHALLMDLVLPKFGDYLNAMLERFQFLSKIDSLAVEYSSQDDKEPFAVHEHEFDPVWLKDTLDHYNAFWVGEREVEGVDVEEVWKCNFCNYKEACDWRQKMHEKCLSRKSANKVQIKMTK